MSTKAQTRFRQAPNPPREGRYVDTPLTGKHSRYFGDAIRGRGAPIGPTLLRAEPLRIDHNLASYRGAWTHNPLTRRYACLRTFLPPASPVSPRQGPFLVDLHARMD